MMAENLVDLVLKMKFQFLQTMFLDLVCSTGVWLGLEGLKLLVIYGMLLDQTAKSFISLHQVRFQLFLRVLHQVISFVGFHAESTFMVYGLGGRVGEF